MYFERVSLIDIELIPGLSVSGTLMLIYRRLGDFVMYSIIHRMFFNNSNAIC